MIRDGEPGDVMTEVLVIFLKGPVRQQARFAEIPDRFDHRWTRGTGRWHSSSGQEPLSPLQLTPWRVLLPL